jgi:AAA domain
VLVSTLDGMGGPFSEQASAVLAALADLSPIGEQHSGALVIPTEWFRWLPLASLRLFLPHGQLEPDLVQRLQALNTPEMRAVRIDGAFGERLSAVDQLRAGQRSLRAGWLFVAGHATGEDGRARRVFHPLVTVPVRVARPTPLGTARLLPAGDVELSELVTDDAVRHQLEANIEFGGGALDGDEIEIPPALLLRLDRLARFARSVASAAGFPPAKLVPATAGPDSFLRADKLVIVVGIGVYAIHEAGESSRASSLRAWAAGGLDQWTAFHSMYLEAPQRPAGRRAVEHRVESPYLLTPVQREAVAASRRELITLISGAPGTGKSHTIAAIACDALARGERVLVAAKSDATVDALLDLFERAPGPEPVVFGSNERREALAERLSAGQLRPAGADQVSKAQRAFESFASRRDELLAEVEARLGAETLLDDGAAGMTAARAAASGFFDPDVDLDLAELLLDASPPNGSGVSKAEGWAARRRRRKAQGRLVELARAAPTVTVDEIRAALRVAHAARVSAQLFAEGGLELGPAWDELLRAQDQARNARGEWLAAASRSEDRLTSSTLAAVAALATALRSGRSARRSQLGRLDDDKLTRALPLWVGTLADVDDLLPPVAGLFDLVILDEASSIDQPLAATTLLRGQRAAIAGDPRQLRQVSFVSDAVLRTTVTTHGLDDNPILAARLDVRRNSTFDVAAGAAPVLVLDEHFRSDPHLVDFVAQRIYDGKVQVATRSPRTQSKDCVEIIRVEGRRDHDGVVEAEVARTIAELRTLLRAGRRSVGVVTPFRAQADAIEKAVLKVFSADDIEALDLRVGTVHSFQGNERDDVVASIAVDPIENVASWRFIEDPHLFVVLMTRARRRMTVLVSADPPAGGIVAAYLAQADYPAGPPQPVRQVGEWARAIADELTAAGIPVWTAYPTGRHVVDVCLGDERRNVDIECLIHPDGPAAHIDRHLALRRSGWEFIEAYQSRWSQRRAELVVNLISSLKHPTP